MSGTSSTVARGQIGKSREYIPKVWKCGRMKTKEHENELMNIIIHYGTKPRKKKQEKHG